MLHRNLPLKAAAFALAIFLWFWVLLNQERPTVGTPAKPPITAPAAGEEMSARTVPVVVRTSGQPPTDVKIMSVQVEPPFVTVVGPAARLQQITQVQTMPLPLGQVQGDLTRKLPLVAPQNVSLLSGSSVALTIRTQRTSTADPGAQPAPDAR